VEKKVCRPKLLFQNGGEDTSVCNLGSEVPNKKRGACLVSFLFPMDAFNKSLMCSYSYFHPLARDGTSKLPRNPGSLMGNGGLADGEYSTVVSSE
jgi:hypothetical protein